jgi:plastocyanin
MNKLAPVVAAAALLLAGCGGSGSDESKPAKPATGVTVDIAVKDGKVTPQGKRVDVKAGQKITLHITSDADEEVHVHSEPEHEYEVAAGDDTTHSFSIDTPGQVAVEAHHLDATIVQLVVRP